MAARPRRSSISLKKGPALSATRVALDHDRLVYVLVASRQLRYKDGRSRIAYIGTTKNGSARIAQSVANHAASILRLHGVKSFEARVLTCRRRQHVKMWFKLERALLVTFREEFGEIPRCNRKGKNMGEDGVFDIFRRERVRRIIRNLSV